MIIHAPWPDHPSPTLKTKVWTFHGLSRVLTSMKLFQENADIQLEGCMLLASIGEVLYNNGYATEVFKLLETGIRKHAGRATWWNDTVRFLLCVAPFYVAKGWWCMMCLHSYVSNSFQFNIVSLESSQADLLCQTILIISRLGSSFLSLEPRGIQTIVDAMARHRSDRNLQMTAVRALFTLAKDELALQSCRAGGGAVWSLIWCRWHQNADEICWYSLYWVDRWW